MKKFILSLFLLCVAAKAQSLQTINTSDTLLTQTVPKINGNFAALNTGKAAVASCTTPKTYVVGTTATGVVCAASEASVPLQNSLAYEYKFYETSGNTLHDTSGNTRNVTLSGSPVWSYGLVLDGTGSVTTTLPNVTVRTIVVITDNSPLLSTAAPSSTGISSWQVLLGNTASTGPQLMAANGGTTSKSGSFSPAIVTNTGTPLSLSSQAAIGQVVYTFTLGTNSSSDPDKIYINGKEVSGYRTGLGASGSLTQGSFSLGRDYANGTFFNGSVLYVGAYTAEASPKDVAAIYKTLASEVEKTKGFDKTTTLSSTGKKKLVIDGDSITAGVGASIPANSYASVATTLINGASDWDIYNFANSGYTASDVLQKAQQVDYVYDKLAPTNIAINFSGTNDAIGCSTATAIYGRLKQWSVERRKMGFKTGLITMIDRVGSPCGPTLSSIKVSLNILIRNGLGRDFDFIVDPGSDATIGCDGCYANLPDGIHPNDTQHAVIGNLVYNAVTNYLVSTSGMNLPSSGHFGLRNNTAGSWYELVGPDLPYTNGHLTIQPKAATGTLYLNYTGGSGTVVFGDGNQGQRAISDQTGFTQGPIKIGPLPGASSYFVLGNSALNLGNISGVWPNFALRQSPGGATHLNTSPGSYLRFLIGDLTVAQISPGRWALTDTTATPLLTLDVAHTCASTNDTSALWIDNTTDASNTHIKVCGKTAGIYGWIVLH